MGFWREPGITGRSSFELKTQNSKLPSMVRRSNLPGRRSAAALAEEACFASQIFADQAKTFNRDEGD
jgi:hypothetical protein